MNYKTIPFIRGLAKNPHPRLIPEDKCSDCKNVMFKDGRIVRRSGYVQLGENLPLNGEITSINWYEKLGSTDNYAIVTTSRDAYKYDSANATWMFITPICNSNVVTTSGTGNRNVTANTATFSTDWDKSNIYEIKFGNADVNGTGTWYNVSSIVNTTALTLSEDGPAVTSNVYCLRLCFSGDLDDRHSVALPIESGGDRILVASNGCDPIYMWDGTNEMTNLGGTPNMAKYIKYWGAVGGERLYLLYTIDNADGSPYPQTMEYSAQGDPEDWTDGYYDDFLQTNDEIRGAERIQTRLCIYKGLSISLVAPEGPSADNAMIIQQNVVNEVGSRAGATVAGFDKFNIFMGSDDKVYFFDGLNIRKISEDIEPDLMSSVNTGKVQRSFALVIPEENIYILMVPTSTDYPDKAYVYNYVDDAWSVWEFAHSITAAGYWKDQSLMTIQDLYDAGDTYEDLLETGIRCVDWLQIGDVPTVLFGDKDGYIYEFGNAGTDDGENIDAHIVTRDFPFATVETGEVRNSKLLKLEIGFTGGSGNMQVCSSPNYAETWSPWMTLSLASPTSYVERVAQIIQRGRQHRFWIKNVEGAYFEIESITAGFVDAGGNIDH